MSVCRFLGTPFGRDIPKSGSNGTALMIGYQFRESKKYSAWTSRGSSKRGVCSASRIGTVKENCEWADVRLANSTVQSVEQLSSIVLKCMTPLNN